MERRQVEAQRGLAPLGQQLTTYQRELADHLRDLRSRTGLSSEKLSDRLSDDGLHVDRTRLSKFLNGREVPRPELASSLHHVVAECEGTEARPEDVARTRLLIYAARNHGSTPEPALSAELDEAREQVRELRQAMETERKGRAQVDAELHALREECRADRRRISELEEQARGVRSAGSTQQVQHTLGEYNRQAMAQKAALDFHAQLEELRVTYQAMADAGRCGDGPAEMAAVNAVQPTVAQFTGRFFAVFNRGVAATPEPQRGWLENLMDGMITLCWVRAGDIDAPERDTFRPTTITKRIDAELRWVEWAQEVLLMVVTGSTETPREPDQPLM
ncbi:helix-turn-helix domain-containing protein [Streptomyces sp. KM273126]|uniref:helix-turn-helix domain-containing protein n=1 Tax=Streptomyces sp. KM273126 TaxID=2545247 RepID=UPI001404F3F3|nr:helix-turn-helix domain-containing protein [Streptomyces sp. KM273126]MBA2807196.1 helix-turn-helix domain-containing protein [Streptomyces sp. KM273126]